MKIATLTQQIDSLEKLAEEHGLIEALAFLQSARKNARPITPHELGVLHSACNDVLIKCPYIEGSPEYYEYWAGFEST